MFEVRISTIHGNGVFARKPITKGTHIGHFLSRKTSQDGMHVLWVETKCGRWEAYEGTGHLRFLNHASTPNSEFDGLELYATKDINKDEEITIHYGDEFEESAE